MSDPQAWPALPLQEWQDTYRTLHMWTQIIGKIRMCLSVPLNQWWHVPLYVSARGLTTGPVPYEPGIFEIEFDFQRQELQITPSNGLRIARPLKAECVASFYEAVVGILPKLGIDVHIDPHPQELQNAIPFDQDTTNCSYEPEYANRFWRILVSSSKVLQRFRGEFVGKCSPVHFFWGSFDLACTRFSGRPAPPRKGVISGPAYSQEVSSAGFWPGGGAVEGPAYYAYNVPAPEGLDKAVIKPASAGWNKQLGEFLLMYDDVRQSPSPEETLYEFFESTYEAGARLGNWDRATLEAPHERDLHTSQPNRSRAH
jgi:hypothetical protein